MILLVPAPFPIALIIVLTPLIVIGVVAMAVSDWLRQRKPMTRPHGLLGKAYGPTLKLIGVGAVAIAIAVWLL